jgi:WD40 repeat protein
VDGTTAKSEPSTLNQVPPFILGKLMYVINDAHLHGVTSIALTSDSQRVVSGGSEGEVRIFKLGKQSQVMEASMKEHRGRVWSIQITKNND